MYNTSGYVLGGSSVALFGCRIYTKAADVGAYLFGKVERNIPEGDPKNRAVIVDNVGDNVGDIVGMGSDLFRSFSESSCATLVVTSISSFGTSHDFTAMCFPLLISSMGIVVCLITTFFTTDFYEIKEINQIEPALERQLIISTTLMTLDILLVCFLALPSSSTIYNLGSTPKVVKWWHLFLCGCGSLGWPHHCASKPCIFGCPAEKEVEEKCDVEYIAGGATKNSNRAA